ncbi:MAG: hypothetical protein ACTHK7_01270 [Aureliella sp.]
MPGKTSKIQLEAAFAKRELAGRRTRLLPGGWWLWCLLGLGLGASLWFGGRHYLRSELVLQLTSAESDADALASIDALMRLDGDAAVDVSRALAHPDFVVAHAAYRALNEQIDAWAKLDSAERTERMALLASQLERVPNDCDQDHRILVTGLASRLYADALSSRDAGAGDLPDRCKRIMERKAIGSAISSANAQLSDAASALPADGGLAPIETSLSDLQPGFTTGGSVPAPLPPIESARAQTDAQSSIHSLSGQQAAMPLEPAPALAASEMPRLSSTSDERTHFDAARVHLTGASSRQATLVDRSAAMTLSDSTSSPPLAVDGSSRTREQPAEEPRDQKLHAAEPFDASGLDEPPSIDAQPIEDGVESASDPLSGDVLTSEAAQTLAGIDKLPIDQLVRLLASAQPQVTQAAALALRRKGMSDDKLDLAMQLAVGSSAQRLELLQSLGERTDLDPRPWLLWMAADGDEPVREQAIGMLAPLLDTEVRRQLRLLLSQERDERIAQTIRRVLVR